MCRKRFANFLIPRFDVEEAQEAPFYTKAVLQPEFPVGRTTVVHHTLLLNFASILVVTLVPRPITDTILIQYNWYVNGTRRVISRFYPIYASFVKSLAVWTESTLVT